MRLFATLFFSLITALATGETVYISSLTNAAQPTVNMAICERQLENLPLNCRRFASLAILTPGGVTSLQPHGANQLHVYHTEQVGSSKARIVRDTFDLVTETFVPGSTKKSPTNLASIRNFSSNDRKGTVQKQPGNVLNRINVNPLGLVFLGPPIPRFPAPPTSS